MMRNVELIFWLHSKQTSVTHISHPNPKGPSSVKLENKGDLSVFHKSNGVSWLNYVLYLLLTLSLNHLPSSFTLPLLMLSIYVYFSS